MGSSATGPGRRDMTPLLIHNAALIDGTSADPRPGVSVIVEDGRIARIAPASALKPDRDATVIDATERFLLPGLTDAHVHFSATEADGRATRPLAAFARRGATQIKVMASGGAASPTDPIDATQFTIEELRAAVDEARVRDTYVLAHAYHPKSIANCLEAGVRSIEHGNLLDEKTARDMSAEDAFLVPTLVTYAGLSERGEQLGMAKSSVEKVRYVGASGEDSIRIAMEAGVRIGSGSALLGEPMREKARELVLQARGMGPMAAFVAATRPNPELFGLSDRIGTVGEGNQADLILGA